MKRKFDIAYLATAPSRINSCADINRLSPDENWENSTTATVNLQRQRINLQLKFWEEAKVKYLNDVKCKNSPSPTDMYVVISHCYQSLTCLFGANYDLTGFIPGFIKLVKKWDLDTERYDLYKGIVEMDDWFTDLSRHVSREKIEQKISQLSKTKAKYFLHTTRDTWIWVITKKCRLVGIPIDPNQISPFMAV